MPKKLPSKADHCLNCNQPLQPADNFCPNCGQENKPSKVSFKDLVTDFFGDYFTFDSKLFRSLKPLLFQPGRMTKEYLQGQRVRFIPPFRIFIFLSIIFLLILSYDPAVTNIKTSNTTAGNKVSSEDSLMMDQLNDSLNDKKERLEIFRDTTLLKGGKVAFTIDKRYSVEELERLAAKYPPHIVADSLAEGDSKFERLVIRQYVKIYKSEGRDLIKFIIGNGTLILLILIPIFALILKLLFIRRKEFFASHFVFSLHFHSFGLILLVLLQLLNIIFRIYPGWILFILLPVYLLLALKKVYNQSWVKIIFKEILLGVIYVAIVLPIVFLTTLFVSFLIF